jgi:pimeloyl-ACP methyl ester carboxylesterase
MDRGRSTLLVVAALAILAAAPARAAQLDVRRVTIHYRAHGGARRSAQVLVPAWWRRSDGPLPLVISPHGRGLGGRENAALWDELPAAGPFAVVSPDGQGRRLGSYSWGYPGQIADLARMPDVVERTLPWLRIDRRRIYAVGGSMGGQEALLLAARYPRLLAGAAAFDAVADFALQYREFPHLRCNHACRRRWAGPLGSSLQRLARLEIGGTPRSAPRAFARRSPASYARRLAFSCVPIQLWWSSADRIVLDQRAQSGRLFRALRRLNPHAPVEAYVGGWAHSAEMSENAQLPYALARFGLLPEGYFPRPSGVRMLGGRENACGR